jgi:hypothetical protein
MGRIVIGFLAAALAVLLVHQPIILALKAVGMLPATSLAYNMTALPNAPVVIANLFKSIGFTGWPTLFNLLFWGGLLGSIYGLIQHKLPGGIGLIKGLIFGLLVVVLSNWILVPFIKGQLLGFPNQNYFANFVPDRMLVGAIIQSGFGMGVGVLYSLFRRSE